MVGPRLRLNQGLPQPSSLTGIRTQPRHLACQTITLCLQGVDASFQIELGVGALAQLGRQTKRLGCRFGMRGLGSRQSRIARARGVE